MSSTVEAKAICIKHLEDILVDPMFTIFHVQHKQIESRTDSDSDLIHHFKNSMSKVKTWNSNVVKDFCSSLPIRFPQLNDCLLYTSPSPRDRQKSRMPSSA